MINFLPKCKEKAEGGEEQEEEEEDEEMRRRSRTRRREGGRGEPEDGREQKKRLQTYTVLVDLHGPKPSGLETECRAREQ